MTRFRRFAQVTAALATAAALALTATPAHAATSGKKHVSGYTTAECNKKGGNVAHKLMAQGYIVTFVGCHYDPNGNKPYSGTVFYHT